MGFLLILSFLSLSLRANELILSPQRARKLGYKKLKINNKHLLKNNNLNSNFWKPHSLNWPVEFQNPQDPVGNDMVEYQPYDGAYFHGGLDLLAPKGSDVKTPVSGTLEAGHYAYTPQPNGSLLKHWKPWPQWGNPTYFEIAVISDDGFRFEFHHVDRNTLPQSIVDKLNRGESRVEAGEIVGHVLEWDYKNYHHIHYNIIEPNGVIRVNPQFVSPKIEDLSPPNILAMAYKTKGSEHWIEFPPNAELHGAKEIQVVCNDKKISDGFEHPPVKSEIVFENGQKRVWDFQKRLATENAEWPNIWDFFSEFLVLNSHRYETWGDYGYGEFIIRLLVPENAFGRFNLRLIDDAANETLINGKNLAKAP